MIRSFSRKQCLKKSPFKQTLKPDDYLELWKYFTDDAAKIKDRVWTIATLFFAAVTALFSFMAKNINSLDNEIVLTNNQTIIIIVASLSGFLLTQFFKYLMVQYGNHICSGWGRAFYIRKQIEGLSEIWFVGDLDRLTKN